MQTGLPNRPIDLVVEPVRQINPLGLLHFDQMRAAIVEAGVMRCNDRIVGRSLTQLVGRVDSAGNDGIGVNQATAAGLELSTSLSFEQVGGVRSNGGRRLPFSLRYQRAMRS